MLTFPMRSIMKLTTCSSLAPSRVVTLASTHCLHCIEISKNFVVLTLSRWCDSAVKWAGVHSGSAEWQCWAEAGQTSCCSR
jgi:hypothetical protein